MNTLCTDEDDDSETSVPDPRLDSPSTLTSGMVVCGNLTAALRSRRKRHDAWTEEDVPSALEPRRHIPEVSRKFETLPCYIKTSQIRSLFSLLLERIH
jgi:hypothetical protein